MGPFAKLEDSRISKAVDCTLRGVARAGIGPERACVCHSDFGIGYNCTWAIGYRSHCFRGSLAVCHGREQYKPENKIHRHFEHAAHAHIEFSLSHSDLLEVRTLLFFLELEDKTKEAIPQLD